MISITQCTPWGRKWGYCHISHFEPHIFKGSAVFDGIIATGNLKGQTVLVIKPATGEFHIYKIHFKQRIATVFGWVGKRCYCDAIGLDVGGYESDTEKHQQQNKYQTMFFHYSSYRHFFLPTRPKAPRLSRQTVAGSGTADEVN